MDHIYENYIIFIFYFNKYLIEVSVLSLLITHGILLIILPNSEPKWWPDQPFRPPFIPYLSKNFVVLTGSLDVGILCTIIGLERSNIVNQYGIFYICFLFFVIVITYFWIFMYFIPRILGTHKPSQKFWGQEWILGIRTFYMCLFFKILFLLLIFMLWNFLGMFFWPEWTIITP